MLMPFGDVLPYLIGRGHAGKHRENAGLVIAETIRPRCLAQIGARLQQRRRNGCRQIGQTSATCGLHDHHRLAVLAGNLHIATRLHHGAFPIQIVHLQLDEVHLGMLVEQPIERLRAIVHTEAHVADLAGGLHLLRPFPQTEIIELLRTLAAHVVQQIIIHIVGAQALEGGIQAGLSGFGVGQRPGKALRGNGEAITRITLHQSLAQRHLGVPVMVDESGVEIRAAGIHEQVDHLLNLVDVDGGDVLGVDQRKAHAAEAELRHGIAVCSHQMLLSLHLMVKARARFRSRAVSNDSENHRSRK